MATPRLVGGRIDAFVTAAYVGDLNQLKREADVIGLNIDEVSALEGRTALQGAAECGHAEVCSFLLLAGANPNQQDARCWTPLHHAACRGHLEATRVLLQHGAIASARASRGGRRNSVCARWSLFVADALCGPTPRDCAADPAVRALLRTYERRQLCRRLLCCDTPLPTRHWRRHLRLRAEENDEPHYGCSSFTRLWLRLRRLGLQKGYRKTVSLVGLGFGGGLAADRDPVPQSREISSSHSEQQLVMSEG
ncbi:hypothetical protein AB1Y20_005785 [Prymnesium parvum]|uniref:Uncharacterized protein n=1 Tax=Prymnesium parvum TaxID=97485 RepID=A0AB34J2L9_PRYPA